MLTGALWNEVPREPLTAWLSVYAGIQLAKYWLASSFKKAILDVGAMAAWHGLTPGQLLSFTINLSEGDPFRISTRGVRSLLTKLTAAGVLVTDGLSELDEASEQLSEDDAEMFQVKHSYTGEILFMGPLKA
jgi:hypothetical protein